MAEVVDVFYVDRRNGALIPFHRSYQEFSLPLDGNGYLAGTYPDGITKVDGVPVSAEVRVLLRYPVGGFGDGSVVAKTVSNPDGTWLISGLPVNLKYDVVARLNGEKDVIMSNITPAT